MKCRFRLFWRREVPAEVDPAQAFTIAQEIRTIARGSAKPPGRFEPKRPVRVSELLA